MSKQQLKKAMITVLDGTDKDKVIAVLFNPAEYSFDRANSYKATPLPGLGAPLLQFVNGESDHLSMDLFLDDYTDPEGPTSRERKEPEPLMARLKDLTNLIEIDSKLHAPPPVRFNWGPMEFAAVIEKIGRGSKSNIRDVSQRTRPNAVVVGGDALWLIAVREYDDPRAWVRIAEKNDLDDPREITPGDWLQLPPVENPNGTRGAF